MTPIPLRIVLVAVATFCGTFFAAIMLGRLASWFVGDLVPAQHIAAASLVLGTAAGVVLAYIGANLYSKSSEVTTEEKRVEMEEKHIETEASLRHGFAMKDLERELSAARQLPAAQRDVEATVHEIPKVGHRGDR